MESGSAFLASIPARAAGIPARLEKFGRYFLLDRIAVGGMAEVYRAVTHGVEGFRRTFVVKRILADKAESPAFIRMFCDEARISALLHHPNVVQVYDFGHVGGSYFLAMEYLLGKDLSSLMRVLRAAKASVPPGLAAYIAREAAVGLHYAHTLRGSNGQPLGIVHRDVTPSNLMLLFAGGVKVLDFGIAKAGLPGERAIEGGGVKGKFGYLAPEQARGGDLDGRADIFALGVTLWEMLVGRRLFAGKTDFETLRNVLQKNVPPPSSLRPDVPPELDRVVARALARDRNDRYATAEDMARDCETVARGAHVDGQSLRAFLNDLFAEESSSLSLEPPEIPQELFDAAISGGHAAAAKAAVAQDLAPLPEPVAQAVPRNDSMEIEVIEPSSPHGRPRNPAPPFGVIAADASQLRAAGRWTRFGKPALLATCVALAAGVLAGVGLNLQARHTARAAVLAPAPPSAVPARVAPPIPVPVAPAVPAPAAAETPPAASAEAPAQAKSHRATRSATRRALTPDLTLNPF